MSEIELWQAVIGELEQGESCALLTVADSQGSSPGKVGALMVAGKRGPLCGTVGGGRVERDLVDRVKHELKAGMLAPMFLPKQHWPSSANSSGMVCGGRQTLVAVPLSTAELPGIRQLVNQLKAGNVAGWTVSAQGWQRLEAPPDRPVLIAEENRWCYRHRSALGWPVYLIGGGHVSLALTRVLAELDFRVTVVEERSGIATLESNHQAWRRVQCCYESLAEVVESGPEVFVAIMTHDHERDRAALRALKQCSVGYLGLLGSRTKVRHLLADETLSGLATEPYFHAPLGLEIGSHTPNEIAISIAAQMISVRQAR